MKDMVNRPSHYTDGKIEVIEFIEDKKLGFCLGNAVKYISRAGKKADADMNITDKAIQDLEKAIWYINRRIDELKKEKVCSIEVDETPKDTISTFTPSPLMALYRGKPVITKDTKARIETKVQEEQSNSSDWKEAIDNFCKHLEDMGIGITKISKKDPCYSCKDRKNCKECQYNPLRKVD